MADGKMADAGSAPPPDLAELKQALRRHGLQCRNLVCDLEGGAFGAPLLHFFEARRGAHLSGKVVRAFTEGEVYHWPLLSHANVAPLVDVVFAHDRLSVFLTVDRRASLRDVVHREAFFRDARCLERKKGYARGVLAGLAYLHGRGLALMGLCDRSVAVCRRTDQAVLADMGRLTCARRATPSRLAVPDAYRAPEAAAGGRADFDAVAAEMWAAGVLALDLFLAHMVPWAAVDHRPSRAPELVDRLSLELLQAANPGSSVTPADHLKFRAFLRCFFKEPPAARVAAKHAMIATFLRVRRPCPFPAPSSEDDAGEGRSSEADVGSSLDDGPGQTTTERPAELPLLAKGLPPLKRGGSAAPKKVDGASLTESSPEVVAPARQLTKSLSTLRSSPEGKDRGRFRKTCSYSEVEFARRPPAAAETASSGRSDSSDLGLGLLFDRHQDDASRGHQDEDAASDGSPDRNARRGGPEDARREAERKDRAVGECLRSLYHQPVLTDDFARARQLQLLREYRLLLVREKMRLGELLGRGSPDDGTRRRRAKHQAVMSRAGSKKREDRCVQTDSVGRELAAPASQGAKPPRSDGRRPGRRGSYRRAVGGGALRAEDEQAMAEAPRFLHHVDSTDTLLQAKYLRKKKRRSLVGGTAGCGTRGVPQEEEAPQNEEGPPEESPRKAEIWERRRPEGVFRRILSKALRPFRWGRCRRAASGSE